MPRSVKMFAPMIETFCLQLVYSRTTCTHNTDRVILEFISCHVCIQLIKMWVQHSLSFQLCFDLNQLLRNVFVSSAAASLPASLWQSLPAVWCRSGSEQWVNQSFFIEISCLLLHDISLMSVMRCNIQVAGVNALWEVRWGENVPWICHNE